MADYIPAADAQFDTWQANFVTYVNAHLLDLGLDAADVVDLNATTATWTTEYPAHTAAQAAAQAARQAKDGARSGFEGAIRPLVRQLQASPDVDDSERAAMGITVPDRDITPEGPPIDRLETGPTGVMSVDTGQRLQHTIAFADEAVGGRDAHPTPQGCSVGAPYPTSGVMGAEIWGWVARASRPRSCDPPPVDPSELTFLSLDTRTPYVADYPGEDGGKTAHYMLRWVATTGEKGPWSETASATIGA